jgi:hypothetical protein
MKVQLVGFDAYETAGCVGLLIGPTSPVVIVHNGLRRIEERVPIAISPIKGGDSPQLANGD